MPKAAPLKKVRDVPEFAAVQDRLAELRARPSQIDAELKEVERQLTAARQSGADRILRKARALVGGESYDPGPDVQSLEQRLTDLREERGAVSTAIAMQQQAVLLAQTEASDRVCRENELEFRSILKQLKEAITALEAALRREQQFRTELLDNDVMLRPPVCFAGLNNPELVEHLISTWHAEVGVLLK